MAKSRRNCKDVRAFPMPSGPKLKPILSSETLALIREDSVSLSQLALIGVVPARQPTRVELQAWVELYQFSVKRIRMLKRGYFVLTFASAEGALEALKASPFEFSGGASSHSQSQHHHHRLYLHPWKPQFDPEKPMAGIRIPVWIRFPHLDDIYLRALPSLCAAIGEVVWTGEREDYLKKSSAPWICVLVEDLCTLPSVLVLPVPDSEDVEVELEYEDVPSQCSNCLALGHKHTACNFTAMTRPQEQLKRINAGFTPKPHMGESMQCNPDPGPQWFPNDIFCSTPHKCLAPPALHFKNHFK